MKKVLFFIISLLLVFTISACSETETDTAPPIISAFDKTITVGDEFNPLDNVYAIDAVDGVLNVSVIANDVDVNTVGEYQVQYRAVDSSNNVNVKTITVTVIEDETIDTTPPVIFAIDKTIYVGDNLDLLSGVSANDNMDGFIDVIIQSNNLDNTRPGDYNVTYYAVDSSGNEATKTIKITVKEREMVDTIAPVIDAQDFTVYQGSNVNLLDNVSATDNVDDNVKIIILNSNVDMSTVGDYTVTFQATDSSENSSTKTVAIKVIVNLYDVYLTSFKVLDDYKLAPRNKTTIVKVDIENPNNYDIQSITIDDTVYTTFLPGSSNKEIFVKVNLPNLLGNYTMHTTSISFDINGTSESFIAMGSDTVSLYGEISTPQDLQNISNNLNARYFLINDIDMTGFDFTPIGDMFNEFNGSFCSLDSSITYPTCGTNYTISNLSMTGNIEYLGLFGYIGQRGIVSNINLININLTNSNTSNDILDKTGIIAGYSEGTISNININSNTMVTGNIYVGGLVGYNRGIIRDSSFEGELSTNQYAGGITAINLEQDLMGLTTKVVVNINHPNATKPLFIGGIVGENEQNIYASYANLTGTIIGKDYIYIGGITGYTSGIIHDTNSVAEMTVDGNNFVYAGGISGYASNTEINGNITRANITISSSNYGRAGGISGQTEQSTIYRNIIFGTVNSIDTTPTNDASPIIAKVSNGYEMQLSDNYIYKYNEYPTNIINQGSIVGLEDLADAGFYYGLLDNEFWDMTPLNNYLFPLVVNQEEETLQYQEMNQISFVYSNATTNLDEYVVNGAIKVTVNIDNPNDLIINQITINGDTYNVTTMISSNTVEVDINAPDTAQTYPIHVEGIGYIVNDTQFNMPVSDTVNVNIINKIVVDDSILLHTFNVLEQYNLAPRNKTVIAKLDIVNPNNYEIQSVTINDTLYDTFAAGTTNKEIFVEVNLPNTLGLYSLHVSQMTLNVKGINQSIPIDGSDTIELYGEISTPQELQNINLNLNATYFLINDIDMTGFDFTPIGSEFSEFNGTICSLDSSETLPTCGTSYTISNLNISGNTELLGLFKAIGQSGKVSYINLENAMMNNSSLSSNILDKTGIIAGYNEGEISHIDISQNSSVTGNLYVGGLVGYNNGSIHDVSFDGDITTNQYAGGITAMNQSSSIMYASARVTIDVDQSDSLNPLYIGGLVGENNATIYASYANLTSTVLGNNYIYVGGIVGYTRANVHDTSSMSDIDVSGHDFVYVGGVSGYASNADISNNISRGTIALTSDLYGAIGGVSGFSDNSTINKNLLFTFLVETDSDSDNDVAPVLLEVTNGYTLSLEENYIAYYIFDVTYTLTQATIVNIPEYTDQALYEDILNVNYWDISKVDSNMYPVIVNVDGDELNYQAFFIQ